MVLLGSLPRLWGSLNWVWTHFQALSKCLVSPVGKSNRLLLGSERGAKRQRSLLWLCGAWSPNRKEDASALLEFSFCLLWDLMWGGGKRCLCRLPNGPDPWGLENAKNSYSP